MSTSRLEWLYRREKRYDVLIIALWAVSFAMIFEIGIYQQATATLYSDLAVLAVCFVAGMALGEIGRGLLGYFSSTGLALLLVFFLTVLPALDGTVAPPGDQVMIALWLSIIVKMIFPAQFIAFLVASLLGAAVGERFR